MDIETVKKNFYELRRQKGLSWAEICEAAGIDDYHKITNVLNSGGITLASICRLANALKVDPRELLRPENDGTKRNNIVCPYCGKPLQITISPENEK